MTLYVHLTELFAFCPIIYYISLDLSFQFNCKKERISLGCQRTGKQEQVIMPS